MLQRLGRAAVLGAALTTVVGIGTTLAHESRDIGDITMVVGFLEEPVYTGQKSGLDLRVSHAGEPVEGLEETLQAEVTFDGQTRDLPISAAFGEPGAYRSVFFPTAAGPYTFHIFGEVDGEPIDESFTSGPDTFSEVQDVTGGQFPVVLPAAGDTARDAEAGAGAAGTATLALIVGGAGLLAGLVALGLGMARRRT
ncbi:MAG TPA: hypothetical protein VEW95_13610 [Candidatus Limnocylindrales bacterium]|nr:hypothetical protein [Candidatus Limnocylindrales bacterium]